MCERGSGGSLSVCVCVCACVCMCKKVYSLRHTILLSPLSVYLLQHQEEEMEPHQTNL